DTVALGSPGYAAPEQYGKSQSSPRTDVYNLGATLHHLLSGSDPSQALFFFAPLALPTYPDLGQLVARMVDRKIEHRPQSMNDVGREVQRILAAGPSPAFKPDNDPAVITPRIHFSHEELQGIIEQQKAVDQRQAPPPPPPAPQRQAGRKGQPPPN